MNRHTVEYRDFPDNGTNHLQMVKRALKPLLKLFPTWAADIIVYDVGRSFPGNTVLRISSDIAYRRIAIDIGLDFYACLEQDRKEMMLHEICHSYVADLTEWTTDRFISPLESDQTDMYRICEAEHTERMERTVQELVFLLRGFVL